MTVNEAREQLGLPRVENGDSLVIPYTDINQNKVNGEDNSEEKQEEKQEENPNEEENK